MYEADREQGFENISTSPVSIRRNDGSERQVQFSAYQIDNQHEVWLMQDITQRLLGERTLRRLATVVADSNDAITVLDFNGNIKAWNSGAVKLYGYTEANAFSMNISDIVPDNNKAEMLELLKRVSRGEIIESIETQRVRKDGAVLDVYLTITVLTNNDGRPDAIATTEHDVTERKQVENSLRENEQRLCAIMDNAAEGIIVFKHDGTITDFNLAAEKIFDYRASELIGLNINHLMPSSKVKKNKTYLESHLQAEKQWILNKPRGLNTQRKDGTILPVEMILAEIDHLDLICSITRDLSNQKALERQIADISSKEQERIGRDIHDGLGQQLTGLSMMTTRLQQDLAKRNVPEAKELDEISKHLQHAIEDARNLSHGLVPVPIGSDSLATALRKLAKDVQSSSGITCHFESDQQPVKTMDHLKEMEYFRLVQEAVNNAAKHGKPQNISIKLKRSDESTIVSVCDDGTGFVLKDVPDQCYGLRIMRYRAGIIGCELEIKSVPGDGTIVKCKEETTA